MIDLKNFNVGEELVDHYSERRRYNNQPKRHNIKFECPKYALGSSVRIDCFAEPSFSVSTNMWACLHQMIPSYLFMFLQYSKSSIY